MVVYRTATRWGGTFRVSTVMFIQREPRQSGRSPDRPAERARRGGRRSNRTKTVPEKAPRKQAEARGRSLTLRTCNSTLTRIPHEIPSVAERPQFHFESLKPFQSPRSNNKPTIRIRQTEGAAWAITSHHFITSSSRSHLNLIQSYPSTAKRPTISPISSTSL